MTEIIAARCLKCKAIIPNDSVFCPSCGKKKPMRAGLKTSDIIKWTVFGLTVGLMAWGMFNFFQNKVNEIDNPTTIRQAPVSDIIRQKCIEAIRKEVNNPSTLDIHYITGYASDRLESGTQRVVQTFSARNSFGLKQTFDAQCLLKANGDFVYRIIELGR